MKIYFDNAATTRVTHPVVEAMLPYYETIFGNPSSIHAFGREARRALDDAHGKVAQAINADASEIYFTSGGTEADNWAVFGVSRARRNKGNHIITSAIEHHGLLHSCEQLEKEGFEVTYLPVDEYGVISLEALESAMTERTILVSIMAANNEIGTLQPIAQIGETLHKHGALFHTDAVQMIGSLPIDVKAMNIDLLSLSAHKFNGPKGIGALYVKRGVKLNNLIFGGAQERRARPGTENVAGAVGLSTALTIACETMPQKIPYVTSLRDRLIAGVMERIPHVKLNGHPALRLPGNVNISVEFVEGESLLMSLDMHGIAASSGSACTSGSLDPSHVLMAMGLTNEVAQSSIRFSLSDENTAEEVDFTINALAVIVVRLRAMSPLYNDFMKEV